MFHDELIEEEQRATEVEEDAEITQVRLSLFISP
jgi:hypothetical protein